MAKLHLILMPNFASDIPHLGIACLSAYLKERDIDLSFTDFRTLYNCEAPFSNLGHTSENYVPEIPDLPLILRIIRNYNERKKLIHNIDNEIIDYVERRRLNYFSLKSNMEKIYQAMEKNIPKFADNDSIGFSTYENNFLYTIMLSLFIRQKNPNVFIIYGGPQVSQHTSAAKLALKSGAADRVIIGEGEATLAEIIESHHKKKNSAIEGAMSYDKKNNTFIYRPRKPLNLDTLPCPDFSIFQNENKPFFTLPLYSSRGCIHRCSFCNEWLQFHPFRRMDYKKLVKHMKYLHQNYHTLKFQFADSLLNASFRWLEQFSDELLKEKLDVRWGGFFRGEISKKLLKRLKASGLSSAFIGIESLSDSTLSSMEKRRTAQDNLKTIELFCSLGIPISAGIIAGFPNDSDKDFQHTWRELIRLKKEYPNIFSIHTEPFQLRPMSKIYNHPASYGISIVGWDEKIKTIVPDLSDIVENIPMAISGKAKKIDTVGKFDLMSLTFNHIPDIKFWIEPDKEFRRRLLEYIKPHCRIEIPRDYYRIISSEVTEKSEKNISILSWGGQKYILTNEECFMLDHFNSRLTLSEISKKLSTYFKRNEKECYALILKFLAHLIEQNFMFEIIF